MARDDAEERARLVSVGSALRDEIAPRITGPIEFRQSISALEENSDGWCATIAELEDTLNKNNYKLELWYDTFSTRDDRRFWYGFAALGKRSINALVRKCPTHLRPEIPLNDSNLDAAASFSMLKNPLSTAAKRSVEKYDSGGYSYFGAYNNVGDLNIPQAAEFLQDVILCLPEFEVDLLADNYRGVENRRYVANHLRRERDSKLAKLCKKRDGYKCHICDRLFEDEYGALGKEFAEAHHIIPLNKLGGMVKNSKDDLITVCANCHRMLHRLPGEAADVETLKKVVQAALRRSGAERDGKASWEPSSDATLGR